MVENAGNREVQHESNKAPTNGDYCMVHGNSHTKPCTKAKRCRKRRINNQATLSKVCDSRFDLFLRS